ncbi:MAG TPA: M28 family peptidase [Puia sp.]|nr:M28 family peptidase [Puia sp.]
MIFRIKFLTPILILPLLLIQTHSSAQKQKKADKLLLGNLQAHVHYLSDGRLQDRRTGTPGEKAASDYISSELSRIGLRPKGDNNGWLQAFDIDQGRQVSADAFLMVNDHSLVLNKEYFPLSFSAVGSVSGSPAIALQESGVPWFQDVRDLIEAGAGNPRFDLRSAIRARAAVCAKKGATALILYNSGKAADNLSFDPREKSEPVAIPVLYVTREAKKKYLRDEEASLDIRLKVDFSEKERTGHNVIGFLDNGAPSTVIIAAHYDHEGTGGDTALRHDTGIAEKTSMDDAGGVAAMIELSRMLATSKLKNNNYLFVAFSGEEQGSYGSKYLAAHLPVDPKQVNYMLDMDRIDPQYDSSHALLVGGYGTSPAWWGICRGVKEQKGLSYRLDSAYRREGDYSSFYLRHIPVLAFYTGPDDNDCNNGLMIVRFIYQVVTGANNRGRLAFTKLPS